MMVDDVGGEPHVLTKDEDGFGEEDEALRIVKVIAFGCAVEIFPVKEFFPTDEIDRDVLAQMAEIDIRFELLIPDGNFNLLAQILMGKPGLLHHSVIGNE